MGIFSRRLPMQQEDPWAQAGGQPVQTQTAPSRPAGGVTVQPYGDVPSSERRAEEDQDMQRENLRRQAENDARAAANEAERIRLAEEAGTRSAEEAERGSVEQGRAAGFLRRAINGHDNFDDSGARGYLGQAAVEAFPNAVNLVTSGDRQLAEQAQREFIAGVLRYDSGAAIPPNEFETAAQIYFPRAGDTPEVIAQKAEARLVAIQGLAESAGAPGARIWEEYNQRDAAGNIDPPALTDPPVGGGSDGFTPPDGEVLLGYMRNEGGGLYPIYGAPGSGLPEGAVSIQAGGGAEARAERLNQVEGEYGAQDLWNAGGMMGLAGETAGVGTAIGQALQGDFDLQGNYLLGRDTEEARLRRARAIEGGVGTGLEIIGSLGSVGARAGGLMRAGRESLRATGIVNRAGVRAAMARQAGTEGAIVGGIGGFGYGEGTEGSLAGLAAGAGGGYLAGRGLQAVGNRVAARGDAANQRALLDYGRVNALREAGQAEGITVNRAMANPNSNNSVSKIDATTLGGPIVQRGMGQVEGQIEARVGALGSGGQHLDEAGLGRLGRTAANRDIAATGRTARRDYDRAEQLADGARVTPEESLRSTDNIIAQLNETPETNKAEIAFLQGLRSDLSNDLSVGGLRRMRTSLRKRISRGELTFGESEANVLAIMDSAANDIRAGLTAQGKVEAADAFDVADAGYRKRQEYIQGTLQGIIGRRNANLTDEDIARNLVSMTQRQGTSLRRFYSSLEPQEQADVAATFAEALGRQNPRPGADVPGDFSVQRFMTQTRRMPNGLATTLFGQEGAKSIQNLRVLGAEVERVQSAMNSRTSKSGVASHRDVFLSLLSGGGGSALAAAGGGGATSAMTVGALTAGTSMGAQVLTARSLMSPRLTRWINNVPRTNNANAWEAHIARLGDIARAEPAIANEIIGIGRVARQAINDNGVSRLAAEEQNAEE